MTAALAATSIALRVGGKTLLDQVTLAITLGETVRGFTVLAVLHDLNLAALFADRIVVLDRGRIVADGAPAEIITDAMLEQVFGVTGAIGRAPSPGLPFVLPHAMARIESGTRTSPRP